MDKNYDFRILEHDITIKESVILKLTKVRYLMSEDLKGDNEVHGEARGI